jgi:hypothetical protein
VFEAVTDDTGGYELNEVPAGQWAVTAARAGFVTTSYGQRGAGQRSGRVVTVAERQVVTGIDVALPPGGAIEGHILDEFAEPIAGADVQVLQRRSVGGQRQLGAVSGVGDVTDDLGRFRVHGLAPGDYVVSAVVPPFGAPEGAPTLLTGSVRTIIPGTAVAADAQPLTLATGQELAGISFQIGPSRPATIAGAVRSADGTVPPGTRMALQSLGDLEARQRGVEILPDGTFAIANLPPGEYVVRAGAEGAGAFELAVARVSLNGADVALSLVTSVVPNVRGRVSVDTSATGREPDLEGVQIRLQSVDDALSSMITGLPRPGAVRDDLTFSVPGILGRGLVRVSSRTGWHLKSVLRNGVDVTDVPTEFKGTDNLEVVLTQRTTTVSGMVTGRPGDAIPQSTVVLFADDPERWTTPTRFVQSAESDSAGRYDIRGLPPARYVAIATALDIADIDLLDPEVLARLRGQGTIVTLAEGESRSLDLRVTPIR